MAGKKTKQTKSSKSRPASQKHWLHKPHYHLTFSLFFLALFLVLMAIFFLNRPVRYSQTSIVSSKSNSFSLEIPAAMNDQFVGEEIVEVKHSQSTDDQSLLSHVRAEAHFIPEHELKEKASQLRRQLTQQAGPLYRAFTNQALSNPMAIGLSFKNFSIYETANFKDGLAADFSYLSGSTEVSGRLFIGFADDKIYTLTIEATHAVWQENNDVWDLIIESLKPGT